MSARPLLHFETAGAGAIVTGLGAVWTEHCLRDMSVPSALLATTVALGVVWAAATYRLHRHGNTWLESAAVAALTVSFGSMAFSIFAWLAMA